MRLIRLHREKSPGCNPLDGREHGLSEIALWIRNKALAVRFVGLGVILGIFEITSSADAPAEGNGPGANRRPEQVIEGRFDWPSRVVGR